MAFEDKESKEREAPLPAHVQRALAEARASAGKAGSGRAEAARASRGARWLALIPVTAAVFMFLLMMPRSVPPEDVPLPYVDSAALAAIAKEDVRRAAQARTTRLPGEVLAVGTAVRGINRAQAGGSVEELTAARGKLDDALRELSAGDKAATLEALESLRAVQLEAFLAQVEHYEATGEVTAELEDLGGAFIDRMAAAGWVEGRRVLLDDTQRRVAFKLVWTAIVGAERSPELQLSLDEQRALYALYLARPHAPELQRAAFESMRRAAGTEADCDRAVGKERVALELWRADKIKKLGELDASYPAQYALGVAYYRAGRFDLSMESFRSWLAQHPDGPLTLRARNHLKAALAAYGPS